MTSVERILQFASLEQEAAEHTDVKPPQGWPMHGGIHLKDMCLTYKGHEKPALGPISVKIQPAEKVSGLLHEGAILSIVRRWKFS